jgi:hypothetical protein
MERRENSKRIDGTHILKLAPIPRYKDRNLRRHAEMERIITESRSC